MRAFSRITIALHRYLGFAMSLLLLAWFASGIVMTFVGYPDLSERERLAETPVLPELQRVLSPRELAARGVRLPRGSELKSLDGEPTFYFTKDGVRRGIRARSGRPVSAVDAASARELVERRVGESAVWMERITSPDQWTLSSSLAPYFPLHRFRVDDSRGSEIYLSERTGEAVQKSTRRERLLAWMGPIVHWIYPALLRRERDLWRYLVLTLSGLGFVVSVSGMVVGIRMTSKAFRRRRSRRISLSDSLSPYRKPWLRWHHLLGLGFGVLASSWLFSGALSLSPFEWSPGAKVPVDVQTSWRAHESSFWGHPEPGRAACGKEFPVRVLTLSSELGHSFFSCKGKLGRTRLFFSDKEPQLRRRFSLSELESNFERLLPVPPDEVLELAEPDSYHYPTHYRPDLRVPYVRASWTEFGVSAYADPFSGRLLKWHTRRSRMERWLYHGLHSWDFSPLYEHRGIWRGLIIGAMLLGGVLSALGLKSAWPKMVGLPVRRSRRRRLRVFR